MANELISREELERQPDGSFLLTRQMLDELTPQTERSLQGLVWDLARANPEFRFWVQTKFNIGSDAIVGFEIFWHRR